MQVPFRFCRRLSIGFSPEPWEGSDHGEETRGMAPAEKRRMRHAHIEAFRAGGLTRAAFCRRHGLKLHQLIYWKKPYDKSRSAPVNRVGATLPRAMAPASTALRVVVGSGRRIEVDRGFDPVTLAQLIHALERL